MGRTNGSPSAILALNNYVTVPELLNYEVNPTMAQVIQIAEGTLAKGVLEEKEVPLQILLPNHTPDRILGTGFENLGRAVQISGARFAVGRYARRHG